MAIEAPPKVLVEKYLVEIAKALNIEYEADQSVFEEEKRQKEEARRREEGVLIDFNELHSDPMLPPQIPSASGLTHPPLPARAPDAGIVRPIGFDLSNSNLINKEFEAFNPTADDQLNKLGQSPPPNYFDTVSPPFNKPVSASSAAGDASAANRPTGSAKSDLPAVPKTLPNASADAPNNNSDDEDIDFEDLAKRFESLKKN